MHHIITATCERSHTQIIRLDPSLTTAYVERLASLLDGTSPLYVASPLHSSSMIGKCGVCGSPIRCEVQSPKEPASA